MSSHWAGRPLKAWRYVGVFGPEVMACIAQVRIGRARQSFWAVWDRNERTLHERTRLGRGGVSLARGVAIVDDGAVRIELALAEADGVESVCPSAGAYGWTRKQGGVPVTGSVEVAGRRLELGAARALIDDTAAYYARHTRWRWCAGVGLDAAGRELAWNLVEGVNDPPASSERTVWIDGVAREAVPTEIREDLSGAGQLRFSTEAVRARRENFGILRSSYRQPFGTFSGRLPSTLAGGAAAAAPDRDGVELAEGYGVMEEHDAWW